MCKIKYYKIHIIGAPGSGKSFISKELSKQYNIPFFHLDNIFWNHKDVNYTIKASENDREKKLDEIIKNDSWIVDGNYCEWFPKTYELANFIIILQTPKWLRHWRILKRLLMAKSGITSDKKTTFFSFFRFAKWSHTYEKNHLIQIEKSINKYSTKIFKCKNIKEIIKVLEFNK